LRGRRTFLGLVLAQALAHITMLFLGSPRLRNRHTLVPRPSLEQVVARVIPSLAETRRYSLGVCVLLPAVFCLIAFVMAYRNQRDQRLATCGMMAAIACGALHALLILVLLQGL